MSFENFEQRPVPSTEKEAEGKEQFEPLTPEEMERWHELKKQEFSLSFRQSPEKQREYKNVKEVLEGIDERRELEREKLLGPVPDRVEILTDSEKQKEYVSFLRQWDQLDEEERLLRLDRVWNELADMEPTSEIKQALLWTGIQNQEKDLKNYLKESKNFKPLQEKEDEEWHKLLDKFEFNGWSRFKTKDLNRLRELSDKGHQEREMLIGPDPGYLETLISSTARKFYLSFLEKWNNLEPDDKKNKLERAKTIQQRLEKEPIAGIIFSQQAEAQRVWGLERERIIREAKESEK